MNEDGYTPSPILQHLAVDDSEFQINQPPKVNPTIRKTVGFNKWALAYIVVFANIGTLLFGYEVGATSWIVFNINQLQQNDDDAYKYYRIVNHY